MRPWVCSYHGFKILTFLGLNVVMEKVIFLEKSAAISY